MSEFEEIQRKLRANSLTVQKQTGKAPPVLAPDEVTKLLERGKAIYGEDNRVESATEEGVPQDLVRAVCILVETNKLKPGPGGFHLQTQPFGVAYNLCPGQRFRNQPILGYGTGFLVGSDTIVTAGHCLEGLDHRSICVIFDFEMSDNQSGQELVRPTDHVYFITEVHRVLVDPQGADYAIATLDREIKDVQPLTIHREKVKENDEIFTIGHPCGLPKKIAKGAQVTDNQPATHFSANLDTFGGNSGSPVFTKTNEVCGILVRGAEDFVKMGDCYVATKFPLHLAGEAVCRSTIWSKFISIQGKLANLADANAEKDVVNATRGPEKPHQPTGSMATFRRELAKYLCSAYQVSDLRRLIRFNVRLESLDAQINWNSGLSTIVDQLIHAMESHGLIDDDLFRLLESDRPMRAKEVSNVRQLQLFNDDEESHDTERLSPSGGPPSDEPPSDEPPSDGPPTRESVWELLVSLSEQDFDLLVNIHIDASARQIIANRSGRQTISIGLINHYDVPYRGLPQLVDFIKKVAPNLS